MDDNSSLASAPTRLTLSTCVVDVETTSDRVVVSLDGELDMADADQVAEVLTNAIESGAQLVRLQLVDLRFADSSAIKAILIGAQAADERGARFELVNPRGLVQRLLEVTGLDVALNVVQEPVAAAASDGPTGQPRNRT
jgi:anti-sigma B factor antagonist